METKLRAEVKQNTGNVLIQHFVLFTVLLGFSQRRPDAAPRADPAHRSLPVGGGAELRGGGRDGEVQVGPDELLQEQRGAMCRVREELPQPAPAAAGTNTHVVMFLL